MAETYPAGCAVFRAVRALLKLMNSSSELLSLFQLLAMRNDLCETLAIINSKIEAEQSGMFDKNTPKSVATNQCFTDDRRVVIDMSDWESGSEEGGENENQGITADHEWSILLSFNASLSQDSQVARIEPGLVHWGIFSNLLVPLLNFPQLVPIPDPYPISPPEMDELLEYWYVVDCGMEVGIFADK